MHLNQYVINYCPIICWNCCKKEKEEKMKINLGFSLDFHQNELKNDFQFITHSSSKWGTISKEFFGSSVILLLPRSLWNCKMMFLEYKLNTEKKEKMLSPRCSALLLTVWLNSLVNRLVFHLSQLNGMIKWVVQWFRCTGSHVFPMLSTIVALYTHFHRIASSLYRTFLRHLVVNSMRVLQPIRTKSGFLHLNFL